MLVVDASVAIKWFVVERDTPAARDLLDSEANLIAPELVLAEVANALWKHVIRGELERVQVGHVPAALPRMFTQLWPLAWLGPRAFDISVELKHPVYDCFYLALAEAEGATVITADRRLIASVEGTPWADACRPLVG